MVPCDMIKGRTMADPGDMLWIQCVLSASRYEWSCSLVLPKYLRTEHGAWHGVPHAS